jgi:Ser/Thr protein kinase RdoA (MazF antagonist)
MSEQISSSFLGPLLKQNYAVAVSGEPELLNERDGQRVFKVRLSGGEALTVRLCTPDRSEERVLSGTAALLFLKRTDFPAPKLRLTVDGKQIFQWQAGCWGYVQDFIEGQVPPPSAEDVLVDLTTLAEVGHLLGRLHKMAASLEDYPFEVGWLEELPLSIHRAGAASANPAWTRQATEVAENLSALPVEELKVLPYGFLHTDVHEGNLLRAADGRLYLLDWEDAGLGQAVFDIALVLGWLCTWQNSAGIVNANQPPELYDFDEEYCRTLLGNYQQERPLSELERRMLGPSVRFLLGWFAARDMEREIDEPGVSEGLAFTHWAIMRSVTPAWSATLAQWAAETAP